MKLREFIEQLQQIVHDNPDNAELTVCLSDWSESYLPPTEQVVCAYLSAGEHVTENGKVCDAFIQIGND